MPFWAKDVTAGNKMINARAETVATKPRLPPTVRPAPLHHPRRRVLRVVEGARAPAKQPYFVHRADDEPLAFAGLWEMWRGPKDDGRRC